VVVELTEERFEWGTINENKNEKIGIGKKMGYNFPTS
jgi:hypothetical protein